jgi:hypothetical protein
MASIRRLVVERGRQQRAGADEVAGRDDERVRVRGPHLADVRCQIGRAAGVDVRAARRGQDAPGAAGGRLEVAVEVVQAEQLDLHVVRLRLSGRHDEGERGERQPEDARSGAHTLAVHAVVPPSWKNEGGSVAALRRKMACPVGVRSC